jgi:hypothetical protein
LKLFAVETITLFSKSSILRLEQKKFASFVSSLYFLPLTSQKSLFLYKQYTPLSRNNTSFLPRLFLFPSNPVLVSRPLLSPTVPRLAMDAMTNRGNSTTVFVQNTEHRQAQNMDTLRLLVVFSRAWPWIDRCTVAIRDWPNVLSGLVFSQSGAVEYSCLLAYDALQYGI